VKKEKKNNHIYSLHSPGVFGESVSVTEGDSVTLNTNVTELHKDDDVNWYFGTNLVVKIFSTFDVLDERFRDRLKLNNQTGSLTITNITTEHTGLYQLVTDGAKYSSRTFSVSVYGE